MDILKIFRDIVTLIFHLPTFNAEQALIEVNQRTKINTISNVIAVI